MIKINKDERIALEVAGLIKYRKVNNRGNVTQDANLVVCNREHIGKNSKTYYVVESFEVLAFLGKYDKINVQKITQAQFNSLKDKGYVTNDNVQTWRSYVPNALVYQDWNGQYYVRKIAKILLDAGIWSNSKTRKERILSTYDSVESEEDFTSMEQLFS